jgi:dipeptidyl aminopeptidase/acylaminoacyl peptidase
MAKTNHLRALAAAARVLAAVGMLMAVMLVVSEPAEAAFPGQNGKIAFSSARDGNNSELYSINSDGTALDLITNNAAMDLSPAWSPDGNKIAFTSYRDGNPEIYTMNSDGTGLNRLTNNPEPDGGPAWSPDGSKIVFGSNRDENNGEIYTMNSNGTALDRLTNNTTGDGEPDWQPL